MKTDDGARCQPNAELCKDPFDDERPLASLTVREFASLMGFSDLTIAREASAADRKGALERLSLSLRIFAGVDALAITSPHRVSARGWEAWSHGPKQALGKGMELLVCYAIVGPLPEHAN